MRAVLIALVSIAALLGIAVLIYVAFNVISDRKSQKQTPEKGTDQKQD